MKTVAASSLLALLTGLALGCGGSREGTPTDTLRFSAIPGENSSEMIEKFGRVAEHLTEELGVPVEYAHVSDYGASVEAFKAGDVQLAWFGGLTGVRARRAVPGARAVAQGRIDPRYRSYFVANPASGLAPEQDAFPLGLADVTFTFGDRSSTSGRLMPEYFLREATGTTPAEFFGAPPSYSGNHDRTWQLVQDGSFDAGVLSYVTYEQRVAEGKIDPERCFVLWRTPEFPDYSWNVRPDLDERFGEGFTERLQRTLLAIEDPALLGAMMREDGLIPATNADFERLEVLADELELTR